MSRLSGEQVKIGYVILRLLIIWMSQFLMERLLLLLDLTGVEINFIESVI